MVYYENKNTKNPQNIGLYSLTQFLRNDVRTSKEEKLLTISKETMRMNSAQNSPMRLGIK